MLSLNSRQKRFHAFAVSSKILFMTSPTEAGRSRSGRTIATIAIVSVTFMSVLSITILNVPLAYIAHDLHVSIADASLLVTSQAITFATLLPLGDWVGNRFGRRNGYCTVIAAYGVAGIVGALAPNLGVLVAVRIVQGMAAAAIVPLAELRRLRAVERHASPEALEEAEIEATLAAHDEWVAAGCPGARSHEDVMAELLGSDQ